MSQREKDWPTVHLLGEHLLAQNNSRGLLFVGEAERLVQAYQETPESWQVLVSVRPLLAQVAKEPSLAKLQAFLRIERTFWQQVDHLRMEAYKAAGRDYAKAGGEILRTKSTFEEQDRALISLAETCLPQNPLQGMAEQIVANSQEHALVAIDLSQFNPLWLPTAWAKSTIEDCYPT